MEFFLFVLIFIPIALLIGIATATIGFTGWALIVPLLFGGFNLELFPVLFLSASVDMVNGFLLGMKFWRDGYVSWRYAIGLGIVAILGEGLGLAGSKWLLDREAHLLKGGAGYLDFILGVLFVIRGYITWRKEKQNAQVATEDSSGFQKVSNIQEDLVENENDIYSAETSILNPHQNTVSTHEATDHDSKGLAWHITMKAALIILGFLSGALSGLLAFGSGLNFAIFLIFFIQFDVFTATGTACLIMSQITSVLFIVYQTPLFGVDFLSIWHYWLVAVSFSAVGTLLGSLWVTKISKVYINYVIALVCFIIGIYTTVQAFIIKDH